MHESAAEEVEKMVIVVEMMEVVKKEKGEVGEQRQKEKSGECRM